MAEYPFNIGPVKGFTGYVADPSVAPQDKLTYPTVNVMINENGEAEQRLGFLEMEDIDLGEDEKPARSFYLERWDVTVFTLGTKVKYFDWNTRTVYDTGLTLTDGTICRGDWYAGDLHITNTTDGRRRLVFFRTNGATASGADHITIDSDGAARLAVFGITSGNLRINGVSEAFANPAVPYGSVTGAANNGSGLIRITSATNHNLLTGEQVVIAGVVGTTEANGTWTVTRIDGTRFDLQGSTFSNVYVSGGTFTHVISGVMRLSGTASQSYADNSVGLYVHDISGSGREKPSKVAFWKERATYFGSINPTNSDQPNATIYFDKFAGPTTLEDIIDDDYGNGGATREIIGRYGRATNVVAAKDFLYAWTDREGYAASAGDVDISGDNLGETPFDLRDENNGCLNEDCAVTPGFSEVSWITPDNRIVRFRISTDSGAAVAYTDESFDVPMRDLLKRMNEDQTGALAYYYRGQRLTIYQVRIAGEWLWLIYDHKIKAWQPPQQILPVSSFFERKGVLYGTDANDDTVYSFFTSFSDNGSAIDSELWIGNYNIRDAKVRTATANGIVTPAALVRLQSHVTNRMGGRQSGSEKTINGADYSYEQDRSVGAVAVGDDGAAQETVLFAEWKATWDVYPSEGNRVQVCVKQSVEGGYYRVSSISIEGLASSESFSPNA